MDKWYLNKSNKVIAIFVSELKFFTFFKIGTKLIVGIGKTGLYLRHFSDVKPDVRFLCSTWSSLMLNS